MPPWRSFTWSWSGALGHRRICNNLYLKLVVCNLWNIKRRRLLTCSPLITGNIAMGNNRPQALHWLCKAAGLDRLALSELFLTCLQLCFLGLSIIAIFLIDLLVQLAMANLHCFYLCMVWAQFYTDDSNKQLWEWGVFVSNIRNDAL